MSRLRQDVDAYVDADIDLCQDAKAGRDGSVLKIATEEIATEEGAEGISSSRFRAFGQIESQSLASEDFGSWCSWLLLTPQGVDQT